MTAATSSASDMSNGRATLAHGVVMMPTAQLRFVEKSNRRILQQLWRGPYSSDAGEWRDVSLVVET